jgi:anti-sigma factor RsiW
MTNKEASFLLGSCRPGGADLSDPEFAEALAQADRDPALKAWLEDQCRFDTAIAARLRSVAPPADLRSRILAGGRVSRPVPFFSARRLWAIAAIVMAFAGLGLWFTTQDRHTQSGWEDQAVATLGDILSGRKDFDAKSPNVADLQAWLHNNGSPMTGDLPANLARLQSLGCKTIYWNGRPISIICFHGPGGELVHLAMIDRTALDNPPPQGHPVFGNKDGWQTAAWSQGDMAMMLLTRAPESQLRAILALLTF